MHHFFVEPADLTETELWLRGDNYRHAAQVLRVRPGEQLMVSDGAGSDYICEVLALETDSVRCCICFREQTHELQTRICLYQALPKGDKMELIVQKAVELGAYRIVPVQMKNCVVKLDAKKSAARQQRWQAIAEAAAKQSKRGMVPEVAPLMKLDEALKDMQRCAQKLLPYENAEGIAGTMRLIGQLTPGSSLAVMIGPEGGIAPEEYAACTSAGMQALSLGRRILRTETAALCALSLLMLHAEAAEAGMQAEA